MPQIHKFVFSFNSGFHDLIAKCGLGYLNEDISFMKRTFQFHEILLSNIFIQLIENISQFCTAVYNLTKFHPFNYCTLQKILNNNYICKKISTSNSQFYQFSQSQCTKLSNYPVLIFSDMFISINFVIFFFMSLKVVAHNKT